MAPCLSGCGTGLQIRAGGFDSRWGLVAQPETALVGRIRTAVKRKFPDALIQKLHGGPYQTAGLPDLIIVIEGRIYGFRSEEHTSELQSLMRISYAVFCLKKTKHTRTLD